MVLKTHDLLVGSQDTIGMTIPIQLWYKINEHFTNQVLHAKKEAIKKKKPHTLTEIGNQYPILKKEDVTKVNVNLALLHCQAIENLFK